MFGVKREREKDRQTDGQTDRHHSIVDKWAVSQRYRERNRQIDKDRERKRTGSQSEV